MHCNGLPSIFFSHYNTKYIYTYTSIYGELRIKDLLLREDVDLLQRLAVDSALTLKAF